MSDKYYEGEILVRVDTEFACIKARKGSGMKYLNYRPLRLSEMPKAVERLRNMVEDALTLFADDELEGLREALADFDERVRP